MTTKHKLLQLVTKEIETCTNCELCRTRNKVVPGEGNPGAEIVWLAEGPGANEDQEGRPFVGRAGKLLDNMIKAIGYNREDVFILNTVKCRPPDNRKPTPEEMAACADFLDMQLQIIDPFIIVALGATAADRLLGPGKTISSRRGKIYRTEEGWNVVCSYHPAFLLRNQTAKKDAWEDLTLVKDTIKGRHEL